MGRVGQKIVWNFKIPINFCPKIIMSPKKKKSPKKKISIRLRFLTFRPKIRVFPHSKKGFRSKSVSDFTLFFLKS